MTALTCAVCVAAAATCQLRSAPAKLEEDPQLAAELTRARDAAAEKRSDDALSPDAVRELVSRLEGAVTRSPDDVQTRQRLLRMYSKFGASKALGTTETRDGRRRHILWFIEHRPEIEVTIADMGTLSPDIAGELADAWAYAVGAKLWLAHVSQPTVKPVTLANAAAFVQASDRRVAEQLLQRAIAADPNEPRWRERLGGLYAGQALKPGPSLAPATEADRLAAIDREKLATSTDPIVLASAARSLGWRSGRHPVVEELASSYLARATQLDPASIPARHAAAEIARSARRSKHQPERITVGDMVRRGISTEQLDYARIAAFPDSAKLIHLPELAVRAFNEGEVADARLDEPATTAARGRATLYAREALDLAWRFRTSADASSAIYQANLILGMLAGRDEDGAAAVRYLLDASRTPASEDLAFARMSFEDELPSGLVIHFGERDLVIEFLERAAKIRTVKRGQMLADAAAIRAGRMPKTFQVLAGR